MALKTFTTADGSANQALVTNGSGVLSFAAVGASAGQVIQVLSATDSTERNTTSTSFVTASNTLSVTITPSATANKIFIICHTAAGNSNIQLTIFRDATNLGNATNGMTFHNAAATACITFLDSPNTTSSITYQLYIRSRDSTTQYINNTDPKGSITVMEVKG